MASPAALNYMTAAGRIQTLREAATDKRLPPKLQNEKQVYFHAALAAYVATWDAYINNLVRDFYDEIDRPSNSQFQAIYNISWQATEKALERFNTPNAENTRSLLQQYTGYDPIGDWIWSRRRMVDGGKEYRLHPLNGEAEEFA